MNAARRTASIPLALCLLLLPGRAAGAEEAAQTPPRYRVAWATFIGGSEWDQPREVIVDRDGSVVIGGMTSSPDLPVTEGVVGPAYRGEPVGTGHPGLVGGDNFVARIAPDGGRFAFVTYFGGSKQERAVYGMALDRAGNIVIVTACRSPDAPTTAGAYQPRYGGGNADMLAAKLSPDGRKLLWSTFVGGAGNDWPRGGLALDGHDNVVILGRSDSRNYPATPGVVRPKVGGRGGDAAVVKLSADGSRLMWATLLGGSDWDGLMGARVDKAGNVHVAGHTRSRDLPVSPGAPQKTLAGKSDCWFACLSPDARKLRHCTYLGGSENEFGEHRPLLLADGSVLVTGVTASPDFPTTAGAYQRRRKGRVDAFLTKLSPDGRTFVFSTLLGGSRGEFCLMPTVDKAGSIYLVGQTSSRDFPVTADALRKAYGGGRSDAVLAVFSPDGSRLVYASYLGGSGADLIRGIALGPDGAVYLAGNTNSPDWAATPNAAQPKRKGKHDGIILKLVPAAK